MDTVRSIGIEDQKIKKLSDVELEKAWSLYLNDKSNKESRDRLIVQYIYLIKYVVGRMRLNLPNNIATDDIASYGIEGLIDAIEKFVSTKGARFETYALLRIRGAILDRVRSLDWVPRGVRRRYKKIQTTILKLQVDLGRTPTTEEIAAELGIPKEKIEATITEMDTNSFVSIYESRDASGGDGFELIDTLEDKNSKDPLQELEAKDIKKELSMALSKLPERERMILALYYHENMTLKEIGEAISISESRVCQLHAQAIMKLRTLLSSKTLKTRKSRA